MVINKKVAELIGAVSVLLTPFGYVRIEFQSRAYFNLYLPLLCAGLCWLLLWFAGAKAPFSSNVGLLAHFTLPFATLVGFYIAALAAVASFQSASLDKPLKGKAAYVEVWSNRAQKMVKQELTRRQFVVALFGYLAAVSMVFIVVGGLIKLLQSSRESLFTPTVEYLLTFVGLVIVWNVVCVTLLGIYFLADRFVFYVED
jgi:hypothetical protein